MEWFRQNGTKIQMKDNSFEHIFLLLRVLKYEYTLAWF
jgi:hypothetical protein